MNMKLGEYLREERKKLGLTQQDFVQNIISVSQYSRVENGEQDLKVSDFVKLISINNLDINQLARNPDLLMYRLLGKYFKYLFNNENAKKDQILDLLKVAGYEKFTINLAK